MNQYDQVSPEEDQLEVLCQHFLDLLADENGQDQRNAVFITIWHIVRQRVKHELKTIKRTEYPLLSEFVDAEQWQKAPIVWSKQMVEYVTKIMNVMQMKRDRGRAGDTFR